MNLSFLRNLSRQVKHFVFPPLCFHCSSEVEEQKRLICSTCFDLLTLIDLKRRCRVCFTKTTLRQKCHSCPPQVLKLAAACEHQGPLVSLLHQLKFNKRFAIASALAPFLYLQWAVLQWPLPDLIVPIPQSLSHRLLRGYNPSFLLAQALGKFLNVPVAALLKREGVLIPQTALTHTERQELSVDTFQWKTKRSIADQTILIIDDRLVTGATLRMAAARLKEGLPSQIFGLALSYLRKG